MRLLLAVPLSLLASGCFDSLTTFPRDAGSAPQPDAGACTAAQLQADAENCGACGNRCPAPLNAQATCRQGKCGRGPCELGHYDVDGAATFGCESTCAGTQCQLPDGQTVTLSRPAVHDREPSGATSSTAQRTLSGAGFRAPSSVGESPGAGATTSSNSTYRHVGGFKGASP